MMETKYKCNSCNKLFAHRRSLCRHEANHCQEVEVTELKPYSYSYKKKSCKVKNQQRSNEALAPKTYDIRKDAASYPSYEMKKHVKKSSSTQSLKNFKRSKCVKSYGSSQSLQNHQLAETENHDFVEELDGSLGRLSDEEISMILESRYKENLAKEAAELKRQRYQDPRRYKRSPYHELQQLNKILDDDDE